MSLGEGRTCRSAWNNEWFRHGGLDAPVWADCLWERKLMHGKVRRNLNQGKCVFAGGASHFELVEPSARRCLTWGPWGRKPVGSDLAPFPPETLKMLRCFEKKSHSAQICRFKSLNAFENLGHAGLGFDGSQWDLTPKGLGPLGNCILALGENAWNGITAGKNGKQKKPLVSQSPFLFQGCYKYPAKPHHAAALQLQGHLVLGFVSWPEETSALSYLPPQETAPLCLKFV